MSDHDQIAYGDPLEAFGNGLDFTGPTPIDTAAREQRIVMWLDNLHHLDLTIAPLRARYGPGGTFDHERKVLLASFRDEARLTKLQAGEKTTEAALDDVAHAHVGYQEFIERALTERTQMATLEAERVRLDGLIALYRSMIYFDGRVAGL